MTHCIQIPSCQGFRFCQIFFRSAHAEVRQNVLKFVLRLKLTLADVRLRDITMVSGTSIESKNVAALGFKPDAPFAPVRLRSPS